jgi:hypothetical protein
MGPAAQVGQGRGKVRPRVAQMGSLEAGPGPSIVKLVGQGKVPSIVGHGGVG